MKKTVGDIVREAHPKWSPEECREAALTINQCRRNMLARCTDQGCKDYHNYGGRGITVCDEWADELDGRAAFAEWAVTHGWAPGLTIDRKENDKGYTPDNCRFIGRVAQGLNRRTSHSIPVPVSIVREWTGLCGTKWGRLMARGPEAIAAELVRRREMQNEAHAEQLQRLRTGKCPICGRETTHVYRAPASNHHLIVVGCPHCAELMDIYAAAHDAGAIKG